MIAKIARFFRIFRPAAVFTRPTCPEGLECAHARPCKASYRGDLTSLANEIEPDRVPCIGLSNELDASAGDGWAVIPYGEWPHEKGLQRFGKPEAEEMVRYFKGTWNRIKRAVVGMPIFRGHPDVAGLANQYPDKATYGAIADLEVRDHGLALRPILSTAGAALVNEKGLKFFSPHWLARTRPPEGGRPVFAPALLVSIGLTDRPNISGTSLVNDQPESRTRMDLLKLIGLLGLANTATEADVEAHLASLSKRPEPTALANEQTARTTAEAKVTELTAKLTAAETALANEKTAAAAAVKTRDEGLVAAAIAAGRILPAAKDVWLARLARDFAAESIALANEKAALKTAAVTETLGTRKPASAASTKFTALVNERVAAGEPWDAAWHAVKASPEGKTLYTEMQTAPAA